MALRLFVSLVSALAALILMTSPQSASAAPAFTRARTAEVDSARLYDFRSQATGRD
jgi:hypothetical protein